MRHLAFLSMACGSPKESGTIPPDPHSETGTPEVPPDPNAPIVIYWTLDTLSRPTAEAIDSCGWLTELVAPWGLDVGCFDGGIAPSTWTGESHARTLYPRQTVGDLRSRIRPECGEEPAATVELATAIGGSAIWASDNPMFQAGVSAATCDDGESVWAQGTAAAFHGVGMDEDMAVVAEEERPVRSGISFVLGEAAAGRPVVAYLNELQAGGHRPRCYHDPYAPGCDGFWDEAVALGVIDDDADRVVAWLDHGFWGTLAVALPDVMGTGGREDELASLAWDAIVDSALDLRDVTLAPDLVTLLDGLKDLGRLDDVRIVLLGDHGETPCVEEPITGLINCDHAGVPTWWISPVPVFTIPASLGQSWVEAGLVSGDGAPWSTVNVAYGLFQSVAGDAPADWPAPEPTGSATTWQCLEDSVRGMRIEGELSLRCAESACAAMSWGPLPGLLDDPVSVDPMPPELVPWSEPDGAFAHWFGAACGVPEADMKF